MIINNQNINIDDLFDKKYFHNKLKNGIFLSDNQIMILKMFNIDPEMCSGIDDLIFMIEEELENEYDEDLDMVSKEISEFNYYTNTNK